MCDLRCNRAIGIRFQKSYWYFGTTELPEDFVDVHLHPEPLHINIFPFDMETLIYFYNLDLFTQMIIVVTCYLTIYLANKLKYSLK